jgi:outer membrane protein TolC
MDDNPEWTLGIVVTFPLGNRSSKGDLRIAQMEARQALLNLKKLEQEILVEIDNAISELETNKQRIEATKISKRLAEESLRAEELKLREGLSTSHNVLQFQEDLTEAMSREISAIIDYNKSLVELSRVKGTVLQEEGIKLSEYTTRIARR